MALHTHTTKLPGFELHISRSLFGLLWPAGIPLLLSFAFLEFNAVNLESARAMVVALALSSAGLLYRGLRSREFIKQLAATALFGGFFIWYAYPAAITLFSSSQEIGVDLPVVIDPETIFRSLVLLSLFLLSAAISIKVFGGNQLAKMSVLKSRPMTDSHILLLLVLTGCTIGLLPIFILSSGFNSALKSILQSRIIEKPWLQIENLGNQSSAFTYLTSSILIASVSLLWIIIYQGRRKAPGVRIALGALALTISAILFLDQGTRSVSALIFLPPIILVIQNKLRQYRFRSVVLAVLLVFLVVFVLQFQLVFRTEYDRSHLNESLFKNWATLGGTIDYFKETLLAASLVPGYHDYFKESILLQFISSPIPRFIWPSKPASTLVWYYSLWRLNIDIYQGKGNTFPGIVGQFYMSWGVFGPILVGLLMGWISARINFFLFRASFINDPFKTATGALWAVWIFMSYRVLSPGFLYPVLIAGLLVALSRRNNRYAKGYPLKWAYPESESAQGILS
ncbi:MAG: oligosaccharide repeat unit polymerase [Candidatus Helarchaeota archaeon]|nr:oligosaccharide repeat unit polymerase [Candidatus Helarchaeota archaeon]